MTKRTAILALAGLPLTCFQPASVAAGQPAQHFEESFCELDAGTLFCTATSTVTKTTATPSGRFIVVVNGSQSISNGPDVEPFLSRRFHNVFMVRDGESFLVQNRIRTRFGTDLACVFTSRFVLVNGSVRTDKSNVDCTDG